MKSTEVMGTNDDEGAHHVTFSWESYMCNLSESNIATFLILGGHNSQGLLFILNEIHKYEHNRKPSQSISSKTQTANLNSKKVPI